MAGIPHWYMKSRAQGFHDPQVDLVVLAGINRSALQQDEIIMILTHGGYCISDLFHS